MLGDHDVGATIAVADFAKSKSFYEDTLGLKLVMEQEDSAVYQSGSSRVLVYPLRLRRHEQGDGRNLGGWHSTRLDRRRASWKRRVVRALRSSGNHARRRYPLDGWDAGRVVQGSGRQHHRRDRPIEACDSRLTRAAGTHMSRGGSPAAPAPRTRSSPGRAYFSASTFQTAGVRSKPCLSGSLWRWPSARSRWLGASRTNRIPNTQRRVRWPSSAISRR
jgi:catechol 2,3-dioxygenase-like lactoylglutathione lyase family enzyme